MSCSLKCTKTALWRVLYIETVYPVLYLNGAEEIRTPGLDNANVARSQLRYSPLNTKRAESGGFEPPRAYALTVFKTAAIDHSANSP